MFRHCCYFHFYNLCVSQHEYDSIYCSCPCLPHAFSPSQSFNDKRKKNVIFSRKFPFYKNKDNSEQEASDPERK